MSLGIRLKLVLLSLLILVVVSFSFVVIQVRLSQRSVEEDLQARAVIFAREISATIGDRRELESRALLERQIEQIMAVRTSVLQLDILEFQPTGTHVVATSHPASRLAFTRRDANEVRRGRVVSRPIRADRERSWEIMAPVTLDGGVVGAVAVKFSLERADLLSARAAAWAFGLAAASVLIMAVLMSVAVEAVVNRPIRRLLDAIRGAENSTTVPQVAIDSADEFGVLARHFNALARRVNEGSRELQARVREATSELEGRYREVQRLHETLFAMQRELGHAERLALSGRIMAEVAHEVGTPLHSVAGHLELLREDLPPAVLEGDVGRRLSIIEGQVARVTEIIAQLLDLTRRAPGDPVVVDLGRLVHDTAELVRPAVGRSGLSLTVDTDPALPPIRGHPQPLQQVVLNLLTNAMDATAPGGAIGVSTRLDPDAREVVLEVTDTGCGIPPAEVTRIFEPFFSTKEAGGGTGLGLFISAQIVAEHKGRIDVTSEGGRGSTFRVVLPADGPRP